jgi:hypothetical protein
MLALVREVLTFIPLESYRALTQIVIAFL